jgi:hypothetical protein
MNQIRSEIEKRLQEKEEEFENTRKNHQRAMDSMQANLEQETKAKADLLRLKKKLEADISVSFWFGFLVVVFVRFVYFWEIFEMFDLFLSSKKSSKTPTKNLFSNIPRFPKHNSPVLAQKFPQTTTLSPHFFVPHPPNFDHFILFKYFKELEIALDHANRANDDAQRNVKRYGDQVSDLTPQNSHNFRF